MHHVFVLGVDARTVEDIRAGLGKDYAVDSASDFQEVRRHPAKRRYDSVFIDIGCLFGTAGSGTGSDKGECKSGLQALWKWAPTAKVIVMSRPERIRWAVEAVKAGADNYLTYPLIPEETKYVLESLSEAARVESELDYLRENARRTEGGDFSGCSSAGMKNVLDQVRNVAPTNALVLLYGETGVGKSLLARLIHQHSKLGDKQFIAVHCGAIPDTLIESELFGHEKGAFTGAIKKKLGKFETASGGTIFLDEIGTLTAAAQVKLLQILQEKTFQRVGGESPIRADARVIAASNTDLKHMVDSGTFRADLYYRLNVFPITLPSLRDRKEDIPVLVDAFLERLNRSYGKEIRHTHPDVMEALCRYEWPGNVRELENLVERAYILEKSGILNPESFPQEIMTGDFPAAAVALDTGISLAEFRERAKETAERQYLKEILRQNMGRINTSAVQAGITTRRMHKLLTKYQIKKEEFK